MDLLENAQEEAERLNRLVGNLLDMTRLEAGAMKIKLGAGDVQEVIGAALSGFSGPDGIASGPGDLVGTVDLGPRFDCGSVTGGSPG